MTAEDLARKAFEHALTECRKHPIRSEIAEDGCGPIESSTPERNEAVAELRRLARLFPAIWGTFTPIDHLEVVAPLTHAHIHRGLAE